MSRIPFELLEYKQWVLWRLADVDGRKTKLPISPWSGKLAACDKPLTWSTYRHVRYALRRLRCDGIGFVFTEADPFCGIDLDGCRTSDGVIRPDALSIIYQLNSYTELSPSGTGVHILVKAKLPDRGRRNGKLEVYDSARYFTMTGNHLGSTPVEIAVRQSQLDELTRQQFLSSPQPSAIVSSDLATLSDEEIIDRAKNARNGSRFNRLWEGDTSDYGGDHSRADAALCWILAFWSGGDTARMDRLFRMSGLMRDKWDRLAGDSTYGALTLRSVLNRPRLE
jgi:primase-polymerase (primpol)-like protein